MKFVHSSAQSLANERARLQTQEQVNEPARGPEPATGDLVKQRDGTRRIGEREQIVAMDRSTTYMLPEIVAVYESGT